MSSPALLEVVRRMEATLETALAQLRREQGRRREAEARVAEAEARATETEARAAEAEARAAEAEAEAVKALNEVKATGGEAGRRAATAEAALAAAEEGFRSVLLKKDKKIRRLLSLLSRESKGVSDEDDSGDEKTGLEEREKEKIKEVVNIEGQVTEEIKVEPLFEDDNMGTQERVGERKATRREKRNAQKTASKTMKQEKEVEIYSEASCGECGETFKSYKELTEHQNTVGHGHLVGCKVCDKTFKTIANFRSHMKVVHSDATPFSCWKCGQKFKDQGSCLRHQKNDALHRRLEAERASSCLTCAICGKKFARNRRWCLDKHYLYHLNTAAATSNTTTTTPSTGATLQAKNSDSSTNPTAATPINTCDVCGKTFSKKGNLDRHFLNHHTPVATSTCAKCGKVFKSSDYLEMHKVRCTAADQSAGTEG